MEDGKDEINIEIEPLSDGEMSDVVGGRKTWPGTVTSKLSGNDTIVGVSNDTLFAGSGDDLNSFKIGMPKKR